MMVYITCCIAQQLSSSDESHWSSNILSSTSGCCSFEGSDRTVHNLPLCKSSSLLPGNLSHKWCCIHTKTCRIKKIETQEKVLIYMYDIKGAGGGRVCTYLVTCMKMCQKVFMGNDVYVIWRPANWLAGSKKIWHVFCWKKNECSTNE